MNARSDLASALLAVTSIVAGSWVLGDTSVGLTIKCRVFNDVGAYDEMGRLASVESPVGAVTSYDYDLAGHVLSTATTLDESQDATTTFEYDAVGQLTAVTDAEGRRTEFRYDLLGRRIEIIDADEQSWITTYDLKGHVIGQTDPTARSTSATYDLLDRLTSTVDPAGGVTTYDYDSLGRLVTVTDPVDNETTYDYDWLGRLDEVTNAREDSATVTFNDAGDIESVTNARGKTTTFTYDLTHRLVSVTEPGSIETVYAYDAAGRLESRTNAREAEETYAYDELGRPTSVTDPVASTWQTFYDDAGRIDYTVDGEDQTTDFTFDLGSRLLSVDPAAGATITYDYDLTGRLESTTDGNGTTTFTYDPLGRLLSTVRGGRTTSYTYDEAGRRTSVVYPASIGAVGYAYDAAGRLEGVTDWDDRETTYAYDDASRIIGIDRPGDLATTIEYDELNRPTTVTNVVDATEVLELVYTYDENGNLATLTDDTGTATFTYDDLDRLTDAVYPGSQTYAYDYDDVGNVLSAVTPGGTSTYTYDLGDRITSDGPAPSPAAPTYDDNGNMTGDGSYGGNTYTYDALGRLTAVAGDVDASYELDGAGNRWAETVDSITTDFDLDLSEANPTVLSDGTRTYLPGAPAAGYEASGTWYSGLTDLVGSPLATVSDTGTTSAITHYDPFGLARPGSALGSGIGYAGEWRDPTGLVNLRARAYDPTLARFIGRDTYGGVLSAPQSANRYSYAQNNPYRYTDPSGHFVQTVVDNPGEVASLLVQLTPPGIAYSALTVVTGWDVLAGRALSDDERSLGLLLIVGGSAALVIAHVAGAAFRALARAGARLNRGVDRLDGAFGRLAGRLRGAGEGLGAKVRGGGERFGDQVREGVMGRTAARGADDIAGELGVVYRRTDLLGGKPYIGQARSMPRYEARQVEHQIDHPEQLFTFEVIGRARPGRDLDRLEEYFIRAEGGPTTARNTLGLLANRRHQMSQARYAIAGGDPLDILEQSLR